MAKGPKEWWNHGESNLGPLPYRPNSISPWTMLVEAPTVVLLCNNLYDVCMRLAMLHYLITTKGAQQNHLICSCNGIWYTLNYGHLPNESCSSNPATYKSLKDAMLIRAPAATFSVSASY